MVSSDRGKREKPQNQVTDNLKRRKEKKRKIMDHQPNVKPLECIAILNKIEMNIHEHHL